jgi:hypothetical protein
MIRPIAFLLLCAVSRHSIAAPLQCSSDAIAQAGKLLAFHFGEDLRVEIDSSATELPSIRNPANSKQKFKVLEVWGYIYKARYRMRFIYYESAGSCILMGQEILEYANV